MDRAEAIEVLNFYRNCHYTEPLGTEERELADAINEILPHYAALREKERSKWISVKERLPEEDGRFLACFKAISSSYMKVVDFTNCYNGLEEHLKGRQIWYFYDSEWGDCELPGVTHWMPLPTPPKEG